MRWPKAYIQLDQLRTNYDRVQKRLNGKQIMAVVKANGYGHGSIECSKSLEAHGCNFFAVFTIEEGIELRENGINSKILVFSRIEPQQLNDAIKNELILNVSDPSDLKEFINFHISNGESPKFHLKIDTGMTRLGIDLGHMEEVFKLLKSHPELDCDGIYSHYATADEGDLRYAVKQESKFKSILDMASILGIKFNYIHLSNSGAVLNIDQNPYNIVRVGLLLYGAYPSEEVPTDLGIEPVLAFKAPIVSIRKVPKGTAVSYGGVYHTKMDTQIGVIQCGFADGYPRPWYREGYVIYKGTHFKIAGRICMDQFMVDFGNAIPNEGDEVLLMGRDGNDVIPMESIANSINSTPYVLATALGGRTRRIYQD